MRAGPVRALFRRHPLVPGLSVAVSVRGGPAQTVVAGLADVERARPVTTDTVFQAASVSKAVFATAVMALVERGALDLEAPIERHLRSWAVPKVDGWAPRLTLRLLLSHLGGLTTWGFDGYTPGRPRPTNLQILAGAPPANSEAVVPERLPGLTWHYSGGAYQVIQQVVEDVTGVPVQAHVEGLVLRPLAMTSSCFQMPVARRLAGRAASGYEEGRMLRGRCRVLPEIGAAALWSTPSDLLRFLAGIQAARRGEPGAVLSAATAARTLRGEPEERDMGLGFFVTHGRGAAIGHDGANNGFLTAMVMSREGDFAIAAMANATESGHLLRDVVTAVSADLGPPGFPRTPAPLSERRLTAMTDAPPRPLRAPAQLPAGSYVTGAGMRVDVLGGPKTGWLRLAGQRRVRLVHADVGVWRVGGLHSWLRVTGTGRVAIHQDGRDVPLRDWNR